MAMFKRRAESVDARRIRELEAQAAAMDRAQAVCEFSMDGQVLRANDNFVKAVGYGATDLASRSHGALVGAEAAASLEHRELWLKLNKGEIVSGRFRFLTRAGEVCWLRASFAPVSDETGRITKAVLFGSDVTGTVTEREAMESERLQAQKAQSALITTLAQNLHKVA